MGVDGEGAARDPNRPHSSLSPMRVVSSSSEGISNRESSAEKVPNDSNVPDKEIEDRNVRTDNAPLRESHPTSPDRSRIIQQPQAQAAQESASTAHIGTQRSTDSNVTIAMRTSRNYLRGSFQSLRSSTARAVGLISKRGHSRASRVLTSNGRRSGPEELSRTHGALSIASLQSRGFPVSLRNPAGRGTGVRSTVPQQESDEVRPVTDCMPEPSYVRASSNTTGHDMAATLYDANNPPFESHGQSQPTEAVQVAAQTTVMDGELTDAERMILGTFADYLEEHESAEINLPEGRDISGDSNRQSSSGLGTAFAKSRKRSEGWAHVTEMEDEDGHLTYKCNYCNVTLNVKNNHSRILDHLISRCTGLPTPEKIRLKEGNPIKSAGVVRSRAECAQKFGGSEANQSAFSGYVSNELSQLSAGSGGATRRYSGGQRSLGSEGSNRRLSGGRRSSGGGERDNIPRITTCTTDNAEKILAALMDFIISYGIPFSVMNRVDGEPSAFAKLLHLLRPGFTESFLPTAASLSGRLLDGCYERTLTVIKLMISRSLAAGYGTVIFDGWSDVNGAPVINVLLRTEESSAEARKIFFLKTLYTGSERQGARQYVKRVEEAVNEFCGFEKICAVTSDNASSCVNARKELTETYRGVVGINDQSHVADLLMEDYDKLPWVSEVIRLVSAVGADIHKRKKLLARFKQLKDDFNKKVVEINRSRAAEHRGSELTEQGAERRGRPVVKSAVALKLMSNTRFASSEGVLESFVRSHPVLNQLVREGDFEQELFVCTTAQSAARRYSEFVAVVQDKGLLLRAKTLLMILRPIRRYLRLFDSDEVMISSVVPLTLELESNLRSLANNSFFSAERKREVVEVFLRRKGESVTSRKRVKLLEDVHFVSWMLDPNQAPNDFRPYFPRLYRHAKRYAAFKANREGGSNADDPGIWARRIAVRYEKEHGSWGRRISSPDVETILSMYRDMPMSYWVTRTKAEPMLSEFAMRTLACSPSSCAAERSFSAQKRLHSKERNRLKEEKVQKIMFCYWNQKLIKKLRTQQRMNRSSFFMTNIEADNLALSMMGDAAADNLGRRSTANQPTGEGGGEGTSFEDDIADLLARRMNIGYSSTDVLEIEDFIADEEDADETEMEVEELGR